MLINGKEIHIPDGILLSDLLAREGYDLQRVAVEKNGGIVAKAAFAAEMLSDGDSLEVVSFVGGG